MTTPESTTPRTDNKAFKIDEPHGGSVMIHVVTRTFARNLEKELTSLQSDVRRLVKLLKIQQDNAENHRNEAHFHGDLDGESYNRGKISVLEDVIDYFERANNPSLKPE